MDDLRTIAKRIRDRCKELDISLAAVGRAAGYKAGTSIWRLLDGRTKKPPSVEVFARIADAIDMPLDELIGTKREPGVPPETPEERAKIDAHIAPGTSARERLQLLKGLRLGRQEAAARDAAPSTPTAPDAPPEQAPSSSRPPPSSSRGRKGPRSA